MTPCPGLLSGPWVLSCGFGSLGSSLPIYKVAGVALDCPHCPQLGPPLLIMLWVGLFKA